MKPMATGKIKSQNGTAGKMFFINRISFPSKNTLIPHLFYPKMKKKFIPENEFGINISKFIIFFNDIEAVKYC